MILIVSLTGLDQVVQGLRELSLKNKVQCRIWRNPRRSVRKMAREFSVNHKTMRKLVVEDLKLKSFKRKKINHLNESIRTKRIVRSKAFLKRFVEEDQNWILFSDEKIFTIEEAINSQNVKGRKYPRRSCEML